MTAKYTKNVLYLFLSMSLICGTTSCAPKLFSRKVVVVKPKVRVFSRYNHTKHANRKRTRKVRYKTY